jgi:hypothetical protein
VLGVGPGIESNYLYLRKLQIIIVLIDGDIDESFRDMYLLHDVRN